ncbi:NAD-glutamate dehydrogenase [Candidatus Sororendozoicomonas aggregata]|uniref:NAD-glutamate dehydrogenase n=1 Tax=Candidatus Sororendozoicomonas aggregata TaxID=3073239 RepID=UPI002ED0DF2B
MNTFTDIRKLTLSQVQSWIAERMPESDRQQAGRLADYYFRQIQSRDLVNISVDDCYGSILCLWQFIQQRKPGELNIRAYNPEPETHYWHSTHSIIEVLVDDMPFLVASILMSLDNQEVVVHNINHPVIQSQRDKNGQLVSLQKAGTEKDSLKSEALMQIEIDRQGGARELERIVTRIKSVIADVRQVIYDRAAMSAQLDEAIHWCESQPQPVTSEEQEETLAFLRWLKNDNFLFIGYRYYEVSESDNAARLHIEKNSGLGTFRKEHSQSGDDQPLSYYQLEKLHEPELLVITKSSTRSTIQRPAHLDYLGVKHFNDEGRVCGEWCFFGLFSSQVYSTPLEQIPMLRKKVRRLLEIADTPEHSHRGKALQHVINTYPRDELAQSTQEQLQSTIMGILDCQERRQLRVFLRPDSYDRFINVMVYVPRDHFNTDLRQRLAQILLDELGGHSIDFSVHLSEHPLVQLQFTVHCENSHELDINIVELEKTMVEAVLSWKDHLRQAILDKYGEAAGSRLYRLYAEAFPAAYREDVHPRQAVADIGRFGRLNEQTPISTSLYHPVNDFQHWHFRVLGTGKHLALSDVLPILEHMGVKVFSARPYMITPKKSDGGWVLDFRIAPFSSMNLEDSALCEQFQQVFIRTWRGELENDKFNALVLSAGLEWRQVMLLRALAKYLLQLQIPFSQFYMEQVVINNAAITRQLVRLFEIRFTPDSVSEREKRAEKITEKINKLLDDVANLDEDRILRHFLSVINAMQRTNAYQLDSEGQPKSYMSFKLKPDMIPAAPQPRPMFEIFVYSPKVEGVHMRGGKIARGGLRWSDRREDFRTEILGLVKAQMVKNAIIVPHGAKGGFIPKQLAGTCSRDEIMAEGIACYKTFISGLLDITDNLRQGDVIPPSGVVRYDEDDPYLVVAADKGTATFSDIANDVSDSYGFWLGDAFASGGSQGYDHKKMGITARGGWESVKRLFKERGHDTQSSPFTTIAIGDMAGDVFGNGMLLSEHIQLVGAFNHMHIFIDPAPDTASSYAERKRIFALPRSSWDDYNRTLISKGGGIYSRAAKRIRLSSQACEALGIETPSLTPAGLIQHMLKAPVDLLWTGGIGTFVKASFESHTDVGDRANDNVRINADELRVKVVGEGGNLGLTQQARIEFARHGGLINTDAVDNSGGVESSDHEVNIKILLDQVVAAGDITIKQRNELLAEMTDEIASLVLRHNYLQSQRLSLSNHQSSLLFNDHRQLIRKYESEGRLNRKLECLPSDEELKERYLREEGLSRPEISVLLSHSKLKLCEDLVAAKVDEDLDLSKELYQYFPTPLRQRYAAQIDQHVLKTEILATHLTNEVNNRMGATFIDYVQQETHCSVINAVRAYSAVVSILSLETLWNRFEALGFDVDDATQRNEQVRIQRQIEKACIWLLRVHGNNLDVRQLTSTYKNGVENIVVNLEQLLGESDREWLQKLIEKLTAEGFSPEMAHDCAALRYRYYAMSIVAIADRRQQPVDSAARVYFALEERLSLHWFRNQVRALPTSDVWQRRAQASLRDQVDRSLSDSCAHALLNVETTSEETLNQWLEVHSQSMARWHCTLESIQSAPKPDLAMLSVAVQELSRIAAA